MNSKICSNCKGDLPKQSDRVAFLSKCPNRDFTVLEVLRGLSGYLGGGLIFSEVDNEGKNRVVCRKCAGLLGTVFSNLQELQKRRAEDSYFTEMARPSNRQPIATTPRRPMRRKRRPPPTPVGKRIVKIYKSDASYQILMNKVKGIVKKEMTNLAKVSSFGAEKITRDNWLPSNSVVTYELKKFAPLSYKVLQGWLCKFRTPKSPENFYNLVRSVMGIVLRARNERVNLFQKSISLALFLGKASISVSL
jgi:hypothetical protein